MPHRDAARQWLGVPLRRPRVAFFEFTSCEGCQLQVLNHEGTLLDFLSLVEVADFREAMSERSDDYEVAFVEGCISRADEVTRLRRIRRNARTLVALGACACLGGVPRMRNRFPGTPLPGGETRAGHPVSAEPVRAIDEVVAVDLKVHGCPFPKEELEKVVLHLALGKAIETPCHPVCFECKANGNLCLFDLGELCLGPVTRGGCDAWCPGSRFGCWGCRGPAVDANLDSLRAIAAERGFSAEDLADRLECFGGFTGWKTPVPSPRHRRGKGRTRPAKGRPR
jgi:coenzyme F420-reducing hydrogenase gamma subunit